ncbi:hypothetical protein NGRA_0288 [Nosema granulosis]|uniref:Uncharacterized protein n=1 Tax=Nosema granulosis TaxID=83296 RepID=A0A9P6H1P1_9MICR|nr:hypothetical protein NGRA_0288 [Nosema granulosis]
MIGRGEYVVKGILPISKSLASQKSLNKDPKEGDIHKCVLEKNGDKFVVYFLDDISFGKDSTILISKDKSTNLLYKDEYKIVKKKEYKINKKLIERLISEP